MYILKTKLNRPRFDDKWVQRSRLIKRLDEGLKKRLTLISAPAGYGKTTLPVHLLACVRTRGSNPCKRIVKRRDSLSS